MERGDAIGVPLSQREWPCPAAQGDLSEHAQDSGSECIYADRFVLDN